MSGLTNYIVILTLPPSFLTRRYSGVRLFSLDSSGLLQPSVFDIRLAASPWSIDGDGMGRLWVCLADKDSPVKCYRPTDGKVKYIYWFLGNV